MMLLNFINTISFRKLFILCFKQIKLTKIQYFIVEVKVIKIEIVRLLCEFVHKKRNVHCCNIDQVVFAPGIKK